MEKDKTAGNVAWMRREMLI